VSVESFRFIHASDFHLENPLTDIDELPDHLRESMVQAPWKAVSSVFDAALSDRIDFLVLTGDLIQPQAAGPYGLSLLLDGFERLREKDKAVYWSAGIADDHAFWPEAIALPDNVTLFPSTQTRVVSAMRSGRPICQLVGRSCDGKTRVNVPSFYGDSTDLFRIGVAYGDVTIDALSEEPFDYWALGGRHQRSFFEHEDGWIAAYPGTPQGRSLDELGHHGYQVVDVDANGTIRLQDHSVDTFRYCRVILSEQDVATQGSLENLIGERIYRLQNEHGDRHLLIAWEIHISDPTELGAIENLDGILQWSRNEYGAGSPSVWSLSFTIEPPPHYPKAWREEDTILGDFLRASIKFQNRDQSALDLMPLVEQSPPLASAMTRHLGEVPESRWTETLSQATRIGVELLRGGSGNGR
jgi:exonuclease SbcD